MLKDSEGIAQLERVFCLPGAFWSSEEIRSSLRIDVDQMPASCKPMFGIGLGHL